MTAGEGPQADELGLDGLRHLSFRSEQLEHQIRDRVHGAAGQHDRPGLGHHLPKVFGRVEEDELEARLAHLARVVGEQEASVGVGVGEREEESLHGAHGGPRATLHLDLLAIVRDVYLHLRRLVFLDKSVQLLDDLGALDVLFDLEEVHVVDLGGEEEVVAGADLRLLLRLLGGVVREGGQGERGRGGRDCSAGGAGRRRRRPRVRVLEELDEGANDHQDLADITQILGLESVLVPRSVLIQL